MPRPFRFGVQMRGAADARSWPDAARRAEALGYSTLTLPDHLDAELSPTPALAAAAAATSDLRIGTVVFANDLRHPALLHKEAATLDLLSDGRLELGIGAGWQETDYTQTGIPYDRPGVRIARLAEAVRIIKDLFGGQPVSFAGEHYEIDQLEGKPSPVQQPHPPILMGGGGRRMLELAAREADIVGVNPSMFAGKIDSNVGPSSTIAATDDKLSWIRAAAADRFDDLELQVRVHVATITDDAVGMAEAIAPAFGVTPQEAMDTPHSLAGSVDQVIEKVESLRERFGISYFGWSDDALESLAPVVAKLAGR